MLGQKYLNCGIQVFQMINGFPLFLEDKKVDDAKLLAKCPMYFKPIKLKITKNV